MPGRTDRDGRRNNDTVDNTPAAPGSRLSAPIAALIAVLSLAGAVAAGHLVAAFVGPDASPFIAVGNAFIDFTPGWLKDFATSTFGTADKPVLLAAMAVVLLLLAGLTGLASRRRDTPGVVVAVVLGLVGVAAVLRANDVGLAGVLAPLVSLGVGVLLFRWLHAKAFSALPGPADTGQIGQHTGPTSQTRQADAESPASAAESGSLIAAGSEASRRGFLVASGAVAVGAGVAGAAGQFLIGSTGAQASRQAIAPLAVADPAPPLPTGADFAKLGTPTYLTKNADFYRIDTALAIPQVRAETWKLRVHGMVQRELMLSYDDLRRRQLIERPVTLTCVSNEVGGDLISTANFTGVRLRDVLLEAGVRPGADQILSRSSDGWTAGTPVDVVMEPDREAMLAIAMNGEPLPVEHGFPVRMVVPGLYGYLSATKWVVDLELTTFDAAQCYWVQRGWGARGPVKTESRIDVPGNFAKVKGRQVTVAGIAWAQPKGVAKVEVRVNGGPWIEAQLSADVSNRTWRMWQARLDLDPGQHYAEARATDKIGYTQTADRADPMPDGATGWPSRNFTVTT